jgi:TRAP-type uncharacterized transport system substrate-binding protein
MRIALAAVLCLITCAASAAPQGKSGVKANNQIKAKETPAPNPAPKESLREVYRARLNDNVLTVMAGSPGSTDLNIAYDIAETLNDGDTLRVLPVVGQGGAQSIKDVLFLRGIDLGITQANILRHYARTGELGTNLVGQVTYVAKLFNEEVHILARSDVTDITKLEGEAVSLGEAGSSTDVTGRLLLSAMGVNVRAVQLGDADAIEKLKSGEIAAAFFIGGKPAPVLATLKDAGGLKVLPIPYADALENDYYPATLTHADYPELIPNGASVDTVAVCAVLIAFNWPANTARYRRVAKFVDAFFGKFDDFQEPPRHPKWREVNFAATLEGWKRAPAAQAWIDHAKSGVETTASKSSFDSFLAQSKQEGGVPASEAQRAELFRAFLAWKKAKDGD